MSKIKKDQISAKGFSIQVYTEDFKNDYISLTDIARYKNKEEPNVVVDNWMRNYNTIEYLGIWEQLNNPEFNPLEFEGYLKEAGSNAFTLSPQSKSNEIINKYDEEFAKNSANAHELLEKANQEMADFLKEKTDKLLHDVLFTASCEMKNGFARSDN